MCSPHKNRGSQTRQLHDGISDTLVLAFEAPGNGRLRFLTWAWALSPWLVWIYVAANIGTAETANGLRVVFGVKRWAARISRGTAELGSLSHMSVVEQPQARADYFFHGIHGEGKNLVGHNLIWLLS